MLNEQDRLSNAIAAHVFALADYIREVTNDPKRQEEIVAAIAETVLELLRGRRA